MPASFPLEAIIRARDRISRTVARIGGALRNRLAKGFDRARKSAKKLAKATRQLGKGLAVGTTALAAAGAGAFRFITGITDEADLIGKFSRRVGFSTESLQEWRYVVGQLGLDQDQFDKGLQKFTRSMGEMRLGTGSMLATLKKGSPELLKQLKATTSNEQAFELYTQALRQVVDVQDRAVMGEIAFGRAGKQLVSVSDISTKALHGLRRRLHELGGVMSTRAIKQSEKFTDQMDDLKRTTTGVKSAIAEQLLPALGPLLTRLTSWIGKNKDIIGSKISGWIKGFAESLAAFDWAGFTAGIKDFASFVGKAVDAVGGLGNALGILLGVKAASIIGFGNLGKAAAWVFSLIRRHPIGSLVVAIGGLLGVTGALHPFNKKMQGTIKHLDAMEEAAEQSAALTGALGVEMARGNVQGAQALRERIAGLGKEIELRKQIIQARKDEDKARVGHLRMQLGAAAAGRFRLEGQAAAPQKIDLTAKFIAPAGAQVDVTSVKTSDPKVVRAKAKGSTGRRTLAVTGGA